MMESWAPFTLLAVRATATSGSIATKIDFLMYHKCIHYVRMIPSQWMYPCNLLFVTCKTFGEELIRRRDLGSLGLSTVPKGFWPLPVGGSGHVECWYTVVRRLKALFKVGIIRGRSERSCTIILHDRYRFSLPPLLYFSFGFPLIISLLSAIS